MPKRFTLLPALVACWLVAASTARSGEPQVAHMVFFTLAEKSDAGAKKLVAACDKYLSGHEGTIYYSAGARAKASARASATIAPEMEAVRVPPSAWITSQSIQTVRSPSFGRRKSSIRSFAASSIRRFRGPGRLRSTRSS